MRHFNRENLIEKMVQWAGVSKKAQWEQRRDAKGKGGGYKGKGWGSQEDGPCRAGEAALWGSSTSLLLLEGSGAQKRKSTGQGLSYLRGGHSTGPDEAGAGSAG